MKFKNLTLCLTLLISFTTILPIRAQSQGQPERQKPVAMKGQRKYDIIVNQTNDTLRFNRGIRSLKANSEKNRGLLTDLMAGYMSLGTSTIMSASQSLMGIGVAAIKEAARDKRPDWQKAVMGESRFVKKLPMVTEILDFYGSPSTIGALDPSDMKFSGFGCRQYITLFDEEGKPFEEEVFYISCSIKDDDSGLARILNHSKFEVQVDELRFNPYLSNLPNDTLSVSNDTRTPFSFGSRKDLEFKMKAKLFSSWINEAIQVYNDVPLGEFVITAKIDSLSLDSDKIFRYNRKDTTDRHKSVYVSGDSFIVPRSYVGSTDLKNQIPSWGTGQYRVDMEIEESCAINPEYYMSSDGKKWLKEKWQPEWKKMKKRPKKGPGQNMAAAIFPQYSNGQWITTLIEPVSTVLIQNEGLLVNKGAAKLSSVVNGPTSGGGASGPTSPKAGTNSGGASGQMPPTGMPQ